MMIYLLRTAVAVAVVTLAIILVCDIAVCSNASGRTFENVADVPHNRYGLLLATSPVTPRGTHNYYFDNRVDKAAELLRNGKIDYLIASGGDYRKEQKYGCDEPGAIRDSLVARGIAADRILLDYDGQRTVKSIRNAHRVYGLDSVTLISQKYHNERAIFLSDREGVYAVGYNAPPSHLIVSRIKNSLREYLARVKMFIDIAIE